MLMYLNIVLFCLIPIHYIDFSVFRTSTEFINDDTFNAAPRFGIQCQQLFTLMGINYDAVSHFINIK